MTRKRNRGFTLIELLVVVSIIALLISILLPSLSRAKEQAKLAACQANIRSVGTTLLTYLLDLNNLPIYTTESGGWCSWAYGGWSGRNRQGWENQNPEWNIETAKRPLSVYATKAPISSHPEDRITPTEETPSYKCPSDRRSAQYEWGTWDDINLPEAISAYDDVGTSYQLNFHWWDQIEGNYSGEDWETLLSVYAVKLWFGQMDKHPSRFCALIEDPMDMGLGFGGFGDTGAQTLGFHGKYSRHVAFFLDGHADYSYKDTRHLHDSVPNPPGPRHKRDSAMGNWTVMDESMLIKGEEGHPSGGRHS